METISIVVADVAERFDEALVAAHEGTREPGGALTFRSATAAARCAIALQRSVDGRLRVGVHTGELEREDGELRGRALVKAARIAALARAGEILASAIVRELVADADDVWFDEGAEVRLRGLSGTHTVVPVRWAIGTRAPLRVVIADDAAIVREGVAALLRDNGFDVQASSA